MLRLKRIRIRRFKSLPDVELNIPGSLLLVIGQNGVGKSSVLQSMALLREFARGKTETFFNARDWVPQDLKHRANSSRLNNLKFGIVLEGSTEGRLLWEIEWSYRTGRTITEVIWRQTPDGLLSPIMNFKSGVGLRSGQDVVKGLKLTGSALASIETDEFADGALLASVRDWGSAITSLELLSPAGIRRGFRGQTNELGTRGEQLVGFLAGLPGERRARVVERLARYYPLEGIDTVRKRAGWIDLILSEKLTGVSVTAEHASDGFLRLLALCTIPELGAAASLVLLDEIEDGIEPHILPDVLRDLRRETDAQLVLTSHSPILANYVDPDEVVLLGRDAEGKTFASRATDLRTFRDGASDFGAGELWLNTSLKTLNKQALLAREQQLREAERKAPAGVLRRRFIDAA
jgi:predicted ATPase